MWYFILGIIVAWLIFSAITRKRGVADSTNSNLNVKREIDEDTIQERQQRFENFSIHSFSPTALYADKRTIYFYMKDWFIRLDERHSHEPEKQQQIRQDWLAYMYQLDHGETAHYLWLESEDETEEKKRELENEFREAAIRTHEIEERFASMIGVDAQAKLKEIREKDFGTLMEEESAWKEQMRIKDREKKEKTSS